MTESGTTQSPFLTAELPGIGGRLKVEPDDFIVEEVPAYLPSGSGQHLYLWIEKRDFPHDLMMRRLSKVLLVSPNDIGTAGIKDRRAVTRQYVSVPIECGERIDQLESNQLRVLSSTPHGNKLRTGHLRGNRFIVIVRDVVDEAMARASAIALALNQTGFPNYYGEQRFGHGGETLLLGLDLLAGRKQPRDIPYSKRKFLLRLALSSVQSDLFNKALAQRLLDGLLQTVFVGDVMEVTESGGKFVVEDVLQEQLRLDRGELTVTGPMFGVKMLAPQGIAAERESRLLDESGLTVAAFGQFAQLMQGARRPYTVRPGGMTCSASEFGLKLEFTLPSGVYATTCLREFMKDSFDDLPEESPPVE